MNERQHIALTEAQIIAAEKGELQLETRDGRKVVRFAWFREPCKQTDNNILFAVLEDGEICFYPISGKRRGFDTSTIDLFVSEPTEQVSPKPLYEVGEIIKVKQGGAWIDAEYRDSKGGYIVVWLGDDKSTFRYHAFTESFHRKKQTEKTVTLENKVMTIKEAFKFLTNL